MLTVGCKQNNEEKFIDTSTIKKDETNEMFSVALNATITTAPVTVSTPTPTIVSPVTSKPTPSIGLVQEEREAQSIVAAYYDDENHEEYETDYLLLNEIRLGTSEKYKDTLENRICAGEIITLSHNTMLDLDLNGAREKICLTYEADINYKTTKYELQVGSCVYQGEAWGLTGDLSAASLGRNIQLLLGAGGGDYYQIVFAYDKTYMDEHTYSEALQKIGSVGGVSSTEKNYFTSVAYGALLETWSYDKKQVLCCGYFEEESNKPKYGIANCPEGYYIIGNMRRTKCEVPLYSTTTDDNISCVIPVGSYVMIVATDNVEWIYIDNCDTFDSGWLKMNRDHPFECIIDGESIDGYEVFDWLYRAG